MPPSPSPKNHPSPTVYKHTSCSFPHPLFPSFWKRQLTSLNTTSQSRSHTVFHTPFLQQKWGTNLAISEIRTTASTVDVRHLNHHTANVGSRCILNFIIPTTKSRTATTSIPQGGSGHTRFTNSHAAPQKN